MKQYKVTVHFDRSNPKTKVLESNIVREGQFYAENKSKAKEQYLNQVHNNEPTLIKVRKVEVKEIK